ncbi:MAG TPA: hypothetical protein VNO32_33110, partial [Candidatus Acidoferrum sp.]|nr:hypothetical protein [Candidatus Acidoferrum sp.]
MSTVFPGLGGREVLLAEDHFDDSAGESRLIRGRTATAKGWDSEVQFVRIAEDPRDRNRLVIQRLRGREWIRSWGSS